MPDKFLKAVANLPECAGNAPGNRTGWLMLFCDAGSIDEVMPFTVDEA